MREFVGSRVDSLKAGLALLYAAALTLTLVGCGYTILKHPDRAGPPAEADESDVLQEEGLLGEEPPLPPGHPPIPEVEHWIGRSFLDDILGEDDPVRFENIRAGRQMLAPSEHATIVLRATRGGPALMDIWQIRMDEFGWVTASHWTQASTPPHLDEGLATDRAEFRLDRASESALRAMLIAVLPVSSPETRSIPRVPLNDIPREFWPYEEPGLIELDYRIERLDALTPEDWPGGRLSAPLDLIQILIGTWDSSPPVELQELVWNTVDAYPLLVDLALLVEGIVLAWEVEGHGLGDVGLPLRVGR